MLNQILILYFFLLVLPLSSQNIHFYQQQANCLDMTYIPTLISNPSVYYANYGTNPQDCRLRKPSSDNICCYVSLKILDEWYDFCSNVKTEYYEKSDNFLARIKEYIENETIPVVYNKIKVDCISRNINFLIIFSMIYLIILI